jgi:hypothetical protein
MVSEINYNATINTVINLAYEFHSWEMDSTTHYNLHFTTATEVVNGLQTRNLRKFLKFDGNF